jgi:hypothetical protein
MAKTLVAQLGFVLKVMSEAQLTLNSTHCRSL